MKILFVAMSESIHTSRWINQLNEEGWDLYLFPSFDNRSIRSDLINIKILIPFSSLYTFLKSRKLEKFYFLLYRNFNKLNLYFFPNYYINRLNRYVKSINPDIIHSMETQGAGFLVSKLKLINSNKFFPIWWHTNWGSDIFLLGRLPNQVTPIRIVMENCDYYSCECTRDIDLALQFGLKGVAFQPYPNTGGFKPEVVDMFRKNAKITSNRKVIMVKGYQGWAGRALVALRALDRCSDIIQGYQIIIYSAVSGEDIIIASTILSQNTGVKVTILPHNTPHDEILRYHSLARISIGLSIGDAISTSLLEAMAMGSFPIQSCTACVSEWIQDDISGIIVTPEDPEVVESAIRKSLLNDNLVNSASIINYNKIINDANFYKLKSKTIQSYKKIFKKNNS